MQSEVDLPRLFSLPRLLIGPSFQPMELLAEGTVLCPYCGETYTTMVDTSQSSHATIEDCAVCCRPIQLTVACEPGEVYSIDAIPG